MNGPDTGSASAPRRHDAANLDRVAISSRIPFNLAQRSGTRVNQLVSPLWTDRRGYRRAIPAVLLGVDAALIKRLHDDERLHFAARLALDAAELALASLTAVRDDYDEAAVPLSPGCPLAVEAGIRLGAAGLLVPLVNGVAATSIRKARGMQPRVGLMGWQVASAVAGMGLARYGRRRRTAVLERHRREHEARLAQAELEGRHDLASGLDAVVDEVQRATVLIDLATGARLGNTAGHWKAELGGEIRRNYMFFADVISQWQAAANATPDLRSVFDVTVDGDDGTVVISTSQGATLRARLDQLQLRGAHHATISADRNGAVVDVGGHRIELPLAERDLRLVFDPVPAAFAWSAVWLAVAGARSREHVPAWASLGPAAIALGAMIWAHRTGVRRGGQVDRRQAMLLSGALSTVATAVQTATMRNPRAAGGTSRYPLALAVRGYALVAMLTWNDLDAPDRAVAGTFGAGSTLLGFLLSPRPRSTRELFAELIFPAQSVVFAGSLASGIDRDAALLGDEIRADGERELDDARARGRQRAYMFAAECLAEAEATLDQAGNALDPDLFDECRRRVSRCRNRLDAWHDEPAPIGTR